MIDIKQRINKITSIFEMTEDKTPQDVALVCRQVLEEVLDLIFEYKGERKLSGASLLELLNNETIQSFFDNDIILDRMHFVRIVGINAYHQKHIKSTQAKVSHDCIKDLIELIKRKFNLAENIENENEFTNLESSKKTSDISEYSTRKIYIDLYLEEAGWTVLEPQSSTVLPGGKYAKSGIMVPGKACSEIPVKGLKNTSGIGFCDYVLYGDDGKPYPLDQFMDAWSDANCYMVSTDMSAPEFAEGMQNFDQELGHIPDVAGVSYPDFQIFNDISMGLPPFMPMGDFVPPVGSFVPPMPTMSPMTSLTNAYFDFANNNIGFNDIFSDNYMFNDYLDCGLVNDYMRPTCFDGFNDINWCDIQPMGYNMPMDFDRFALAGMGVDYNMFYNDCMSQFNAIGDFNSMALCQQQLDIMSYCDCNCMDYSTDFLMYM